MTYLALAIVVVGLAAVVALLAGRRRGRRWWAVTALTAVVLIALTIVFDSLMIYVDLFRYDEAHLTGVYVLLAPLEDLAWPIVAALLLPAVWTLLGPRRSGSPPDRSPVPIPGRGRAAGPGTSPDRAPAPGPERNNAQPGAEA